MTCAEPRFFDVTFYYSASLRSQYCAGSSVLFCIGGAVLVRADVSKCGFYEKDIEYFSMLKTYKCSIVSISSEYG